MRPDEIDRTVAEIDDVRRTVFYRDPDRPDARVLKRLDRVPPEVRRAQTRIRTAHWRSKLDRDRRPTAQQIGMSLVAALVTARRDELTRTDSDLVGRMLVDLQSRGFSIEQAKSTLRRMRTRYVDPADRAGEPDDDCGPPIRLAGEEDDALF
ncbi:hypothetical protein [Bradyrhizobium japonicum]|uniref:hypothetical protein n=1 Tax=Bradyrhizobium japonicum TaxID=375 RepID=UPI0020111ECC|nr:hypothetical protein [Bradyrhizobium japonicum]